MVWNLKMGLALSAFLAGALRAEVADDPLFAVAAQYKIGDAGGRVNLGISADSGILGASDATRICVWNLQTGAVLAEIPDHALFAFAPDFSAVVGVKAGVAEVYNLKATPPVTPTPATTAPSVPSAPPALGAPAAPPAALTPVVGVGGPIRRAAFSRDGKLVAIVDGQCQITIWQTSDWTKLYQIALNPKTGTTVRAFSFTPDSKALAVNFSGNFLLVDVVVGKTLYDSGAYLLNGPQAISPDGKTIACVSTDGKPRLVLWDAVEHAERLSCATDFEAHSLMFSPDGYALAVRGGMKHDGKPRVQLLIADTGKKLAEFEIACPDYSNVAVTPDGRYIVAGTDKSTVMFWDIGKLLFKDDPLPAKFRPADLDTPWQALGGKDLAPAYRAMWTFAKSGDAGVQFLKEHIRLSAKPQAKVDQLIAALDNENAGVRSAARDELTVLGEPVIPDLRKAVEGKDQPRAKIEAAAILALIDVETTAPAPQSFAEYQHARAIEAMQLMGGPAARELLESFSVSSAARPDRSNARRALKFVSQTLHAPPGAATPAVDTAAQDLSRAIVDPGIPTEVVKPLVAAGWSTLKGHWKKISENVYEVTDGALECTREDGTLQVTAYKGSGELKALVRAAQPEFPAESRGNYKKTSFEKGFGVVVREQQCHVFVPLTSGMAGWPGNDVYPYSDHTVPLKDAPKVDEKSQKHQFTISVADSTLEIQIDGKTDRRTSYRIPKNGPFVVEVKGTLVIEDPRAQ